MGVVTGVAAVAAIFMPCLAVSFMHSVPHIILLVF
jgi:hypothetical protein